MFEVVWEASALDEPTSLWIRAGSAQRQAITSETRAIDQALRIDPLGSGESRSADELECPDALHSTGRAVGERLGRIVPQPPAR